MRKNDDCPTCEHASGLPLGRGLSRRRFLKVGGTGLVASYFEALRPSSLFAGATASGPPLRNSARNCIFIFLRGAPSQVDLWDLKEGPWTPGDLEPTTYGEIRWPQGLLPKTAEHLPALSIVRSGMAWAAVHAIGETWTQISRNPTGLGGSAAPHIGSVVALEAEKSRSPSQVLPSFVALNAGTIPGSGYLPARHAPFAVRPAPAGLPTIEHPDGAERFTRRWNLMQKLDAHRQNRSLGKTAADVDDFFSQARTLMFAEGINEYFRFDENEHIAYGSTAFGDSLVVARNLIASGKGVRFVQVRHGNWDHHSLIYERRSGISIYQKSSEFDTGFAALLRDLSTMPGSASGKTLLDETLIVVTSEFGRTMGPLTAQQGRDHHLRHSIVFAGGGVRGGRIIGTTDAGGETALDYGWSANRDVRPEDVTSTIYSALGIDYTTRRDDDPLGLGFEYVPHAKAGLYRPIEELF